MRSFGIGLLMILVMPSASGQEGNPCADYTALLGKLGAAVKCSDLEAKNVDIRAADNPGTCVLESGAKISLIRTGGDNLNGVIEISGAKGKIQVQLPSPTYLKTAFIKSPSPIACLGNRFAFLHPTTGTLSVFDQGGNELWRAVLPGFISLDSKKVKYEENIPSVMQGFSTELSVGVKLAASGHYLVVEHSTPPVGFWHTIFHESGFLVGQIGPWDGLVLFGNEKGWRFVAGGGPDIRFFTPSVEISWETSRFPQQNYVDHFLSWFQPRPIEKNFLIDCASRPLDEPKHWIGPAFDPQLSQLSRFCFGEITKGAGWLKEFKKRPGLEKVISQYDSHSQAWRETYRKALLDSGLDVELAKKCPLPQMIVNSNHSVEQADPLDRIKDLDFPFSSSKKKVKLSEFFGSMDAISGFYILIQPSIADLMVEVSPEKTSFLETLRKIRDTHSLQYEVQKEKRLLIVRKNDTAPGTEEPKILPKMRPVE